MKDDGPTSFDHFVHHNCFRMIDHIRLHVKIIVNNITCCCNENRTYNNEPKKLYINITWNVGLIKDLLKNKVMQKGLC